MYAQLIFILAACVFLTIEAENAVCDAGQLPVVQKFALPAQPSLLACNEKFVYVSFPPVTKLYGYKRGSDGLVLGTNYTESTNRSVTIPGIYEFIVGTEDEMFVSTFIGIGLHVNYVMPVNTNRWRVEGSFNTVTSGSMALDRFGFVFVNDEIGGIYVYNFSDPSAFKVSYMPTETAGRGIAISGQDNLFMSQPYSMDEYAVVRNVTTNIPIRLEFKISHNVSFPGQFRTLSFSKAGNLVALNDDPVTSHLVVVYDREWRQRVFCSPGNVPLNNGWTDLDFGYFLFVTAPQNLYLTPTNIF